MVGKAEVGGGSSARFIKYREKAVCNHFFNISRSIKLYGKGTNKLFFKKKKDLYLKMKKKRRNSQVAQWLGFNSFTDKGPGSISGQGTKIPKAM